MKKLAFILIAFATTATYADDSYLYWMINTDEAGNFNYTGVKVKAYEGTYSSDSGTYLNIGWNNQGNFESIDLSQNLGSEAKLGIAALEQQNTGFYASLSSLGAGTWSYVIELVNDAGVIGHSNALSSDAAASYIATTSGGTGLQSLVTAWSPGSYSVPEPNSALLMALGFAAMALRRRKTIKA